MGKINLGRTISRSAKHRLAREHTNRESSLLPQQRTLPLSRQKVGQIANDHTEGHARGGKRISWKKSNLWKPENTVNAVFGINYPLLVPTSSPDRARYYATPLSLGASPTNSATIGTNRPRITIGLISCHGSKATRRTYSPRDFTWGELQLPARFPVDLRRDRRDPYWMP